MRAANICLQQSAMAALVLVTALGVASFAAQTSKQSEALTVGAKTQQVDQLKSAPTQTSLPIVGLRSALAASGSEVRAQSSQLSPDLQTAADGHKKHKYMIVKKKPKKKKHKKIKIKSYEKKYKIKHKKVKVPYKKVTYKKKKTKGYLVKHHDHHHHGHH